MSIEPGIVGVITFSDGFDVLVGVVFVDGGYPLVDHWQEEATEASESAGTIVFSDDAQVLAQNVFDGGGYAVVDTWQRFPTWNPGDLLSVSAPGDQVAGFDVTVTAPPNLESVVPALSSAPPDLSLNHDFTVTWTPGDSASVSVRLVVTTTAPSGTKPVGATSSLVCTGADTGSLTIPASALAMLPPSDGAEPPFLFVIRGNDVRIPLGTNCLDVHAQTYQAQAVTLVP